MERGRPPLEASRGAIENSGGAGRRQDGRQRPDRASACYAAAAQLTELPEWGEKKLLIQNVSS